MTTPTTHSPPADPATRPETEPSHHVTHRSAVAASSPAPRKVSWGAIIAGSLVGLATMLALGFLGAGIGLWAVEPGGEADSVSGMATTSVIYMAFTNLVALFTGGYVAARMSAAHDGQNAVLHGAVVWALASIATVWFAASAAGSLLYTSVSAVKQAASSVASATASVMPEDLPNFQGLPDIDMKDLPPEVQNALRQQGITADNFKQEAREAFRNVISRQEQQAAKDVAADTAADIIRTPSDAWSDVDDAIDQLVGEGGVIAAEDRTELRNVMQERLGLTPEEAEAMLKRWQASAKATWEDLQQTWESARQQAIDAADTATDALGKAALWSFVALLLGLVAAGLGAGVGRRDDPGDHQPVYRVS